ncbi:transporter [Marinobacter arenosus]|uniref:transporter n=1 Tax=Marinobacter arenosus TaxID=2856822 RepID=UPI001C4C377C|nr:transporter [Marinobacter arenosus]MBW0147181.1 transporter [Marinobacter arenosus]
MWNHLPVDANFGGIAFAHTEADIYFDPTLRLENVELTQDTWAAKYIRTFEALGKSARLDITQAYQRAKWTGLVNGVPASTSRVGWSDTLVRVAMNVYGAPPLRGQEFARYRATAGRETIVGVGLVLRLPTGGYEEDKLLNLGENRFVFRPQLGVIHSRGNWTTELTGEVALHAENDDFFNGNSLEQEPLYFVHGHLIYSLGPGQWAGISLGYNHGGESRINGVDQDDVRQNVGWKLSYAHPVTPVSGLKVSYVGSRTEETTGFDAETLVVDLSFAW